MYGRRLVIMILEHHVEVFKSSHETLHLQLPNETLPGAELARFKWPFLTTPCPIILDMVLIFACPLWARFLSICCTFFPVEPSRSMEERLRSGDR